MKECGGDVGVVCDRAAAVFGRDGACSTCRLGRLVMVGEPLTGAGPEAGRTVVYVRVSSAGQEPDLDRQVARVTVWATGRKLPVDRVVTEDGSVLDGHRKRFLALCAGLHGRRGAANRARRAVEAATGDAPA